MPNTDAERLAALLEGHAYAAGSDGRYCLCGARLPRSRAASDNPRQDHHRAHVAAVLTEAGVGFVAEAIAEQEAEYPHFRGFVQKQWDEQVARAERAEAALADLRSRIRALADEWERKQVAYTPRGTANALRTLLEVDRPSDPLPLHRTEAGYPRCSTCDGGGCPDCTDPA